MKLNILQISDLHYHRRNKESIVTRIAYFLKDLELLKRYYRITPDIVFVCGDLIHGEDAEDSYEHVLEFLIIPLLRFLNLNEERLVVVPGNHDIERDKTSEVYEKGLFTDLSDQEKFSFFYQKKLKTGSEDLNFVQRKLDSFYKFKSVINNGNILYSSPFYDTYSMAINGLKVGIIGLNSAWRSSGLEPDERRLIIGEDIFQEALSHLGDCHLKIACSHHPFEMLTYWDNKVLKNAMAKKIDILLNGHIHDSDFTYCKQLLGNLYTFTCGSLYAGRFKQGYSLIQIDLVDKQIILYLRKWYSQRNNFDQETDKCEGGRFIINNFECGDEKNRELIDIYAFKYKYEKQILPANIINPFDELYDAKLRDVFVEPLISDYSSYEKEKDEVRKYFNVNDILLNKDPLIIIYGRKEFGKTTLLKYLQHEILRDEKNYESIIPVFIEYKDLPKNNHLSVKQIIKKALDKELSTEKIERYLKNGNFILLIDDFDYYGVDAREKRKEVFKRICEEYPKCRYILTLNENFTETFKQESFKDSKGIIVKSYYLYSFNTAKIRQLLEKWRNYQVFDINKVLQQIIYYFHQLQIPVTPMAVTLFMGVLIRDKSHKNMNNEAYLIENYLESILEKLSPAESKLPMDFRDKESFLSHIAYHMYKKGKMSFSRLEFEEEKTRHFDEYDEELPTNAVFEDFFKKGILQYSNGSVGFKFKFWFNFFLAKAMQKDSRRKEEILHSKEYLRYSAALAYKAGLDRNDIELLSVIDKRTQENIKEYYEKHHTKKLDDFPIDKELISYSENVEKEIRGKNKQDRDKSKDEAYLSYDHDEKWTENEDEDDEENIYNDIVMLLTLNSDVIRNTREIKTEDKKGFIKRNIDAYLVLMWQSIEIFKDMVDSMDKESLKNLLFFRPISPDIDALAQRARDMVLQVIPISTVMYIAEHLLNQKLKRPITALIREENSISKKMIYSLLLLDINVPDAIRELEDVVKGSKSAIIDYLIFSYVFTFCRQNEIPNEQINDVIKLLEQIRNKHAKMVRHALFIRDTFVSNFRRDMLLIHPEEIKKRKEREKTDKKKREQKRRRPVITRQAKRIARKR